MEKLIISNLNLAKNPGISFNNLPIYGAFNFNSEIVYRSHNAEITINFDSDKCIISFISHPIFHDAIEYFSETDTYEIDFIDRETNKVKYTLEDMILDPNIEIKLDENDDIYRYKVNLIGKNPPYYWDFQHTINDIKCAYINDIVVKYTINIRKKEPFTYNIRNPEVSKFNIQNNVFEIILMNNYKKLDFNVKNVNKANRKAYDYKFEIEYDNILLRSTFLHTAFRMNISDSCIPFEFYKKFKESAKVVMYKYDNMTKQRIKLIELKGIIDIDKLKYNIKDNQIYINFLTFKTVDTSYSFSDEIYNLFKQLQERDFIDNDKFLIITLKVN